MSTVHFFIGNLNVGGFQRLCLDQSYAFSERGYKVQIHCLSDLPTGSSNSFVNLERSRISLFDIKVSTISTSHFNQLKNTSKILKSLEVDDLIISHSLRASAVLWISRFYAAVGCPFITSIHQLKSV